MIFFTVPLKEKGQPARHRVSSFFLARSRPKAAGFAIEGSKNLLAIKDEASTEGVSSVSSFLSVRTSLFYFIFFF